MLPASHLFGCWRPPLKVTLVGNRNIYMTMKIGVIWCIITIPLDAVASLTDVMMVMTSDLDPLRRGRKKPSDTKK